MMDPRTLPDRDHDFDLMLRGIADLDDRFMDALFEVGCDDATPSLQLGKVVLSLTRVAPSLREALGGAIRDVRRTNIGAEVSRVDASHLVAASVTVHDLDSADASDVELINLILEYQHRRRSDPVAVEELIGLLDAESAPSSTG